MIVKASSKSVTILIVFFLLSSASLLSGCISSDQDGMVGIPEDEEPRGDFYRNENRAEISVPLLNTYDEPKEIVVRFEVITAENNRYSELKKIRLSGNSQEVYTQEIYIPENETDEFLAEIVVAEDDIGIVEVRGEPFEDNVLINATVANTNFESKDVTIRFEVTTDDGTEKSETKQVNLPENSMDEYYQNIYFDETPEEFDVDAEIA